MSIWGLVSKISSRRIKWYERNFERIFYLRDKTFYSLKSLEVVLICTWLVDTRKDGVRAGAVAPNANILMTYRARLRSY